MPSDPPGWELPLLLFAGFRSLIDQLHATLAERGHPDVRPVHGFAMQAVGAYGASASEVGRRLGVSKQAAGKTIDRLAALGYVERIDDPRDARSKLVRLTPRGIEVLTLSAEIFERLRADWVAHLGLAEMRTIESSLRRVVPAAGFPVDVPGWFG